MTTRSRAKMEEEEAAASARPAKIRKTDENFEQHHTHWYSDGNVLLQTEKTRYKVHQSRLADICGWFQLFFSCDATKNGTAYDEIDGYHQAYLDGVRASEETVDDIPLFRIDVEVEESGSTTPEQFSALLNFIYKGFHYALNDPGIDEIILLAEAAMIYDVKPLLEYTERCLNTIFPCDKVLDLGTEPSIYVAIQGILLARKYPRFGILPVAFHDVVRSTSSIEDFIGSSNNQPDDAGSVDQPAQANTLKSNNESLEPVLSKATKVALVNRLRRKDLMLIPVVQLRLVEAWDSIERDICAQPFKPCRKSCTMSSDDIAPTLSNFRAIRSSYRTDPVVGLRELIKENLFGDICRNCNSKLTNALKARRSALWDDICHKWIK